MPMNKIRTCIHCSRTSLEIEFAKRTRRYKRGVVKQVQNICITCMREINCIKSLRSYWKHRDRINAKRRIKWKNRLR